MVAQDEKNLKKFLLEQKKDQALNKEYQAVEELGAKKPDDSEYLREMQAQKDAALLKERAEANKDNIERD